MASRLPRQGAAPSSRPGAESVGWAEPEARRGGAAQDREPLTAAELVGEVRARLGLGEAFADQDIEACISDVMRQSTPRGRWLAAFSSALGRVLISEGRDLNTTLRTLVALAPRPRS